MRRVFWVLLSVAGCDDGGGGAGPLPADRGIDDGGQLDQGLGADAWSADATAADAAPMDATDATADATPDATPAVDAAVDAGPPPEPIASAGCGTAPPDRRGGVWIDAMDFGPEAGGTRGFYLTVPEGYDPSTPSALILGYPGTDWLGGQIRDYLDIEGAGRGDEIFVYPDPLWRDFGPWGNHGGWQLGMDGFHAAGDEDLVFTAALLDHLEAHYCVDRSRVFVTGHSWGGDMAHVVACLLGDRVRAAAPAAANQPYWFNNVVDCPGQAAVWTFFGVADDHFDLPVPGQYGAECRDFWTEQSGCTGVDASAPIDLGPDEQCERYLGCAVETRYCLYGPATRHQIPPYFGDAIMGFFRDFPSAIE